MPTVRGRGLDLVNMIPGLRKRDAAGVANPKRVEEVELGRKKGALID